MLAEVSELDVFQKPKIMHVLFSLATKPLPSNHSVLAVRMMYESGIIRLKHYSNATNLKPIF